MADFWSISGKFGLFPTSQLYDFDAIALVGGCTFGCIITMQNFMEIVWTVFEKFESFIERSGEKQ